MGKACKKLLFVDICQPKIQRKQASASEYIHRASHEEDEVRGSLQNTLYVTTPDAYPSLDGEEYRTAAGSKRNFTAFLFII